MMNPPPVTKSHSPGGGGDTSALARPPASTNAVTPSTLTTLRIALSSHSHRGASIVCPQQGLGPQKVVACTAFAFPPLAPAVADATTTSATPSTIADVVVASAT